MQMIFYPGNVRQACRAEYSIALNYDELITKADIVVINSPLAGGGTSLFNTDAGRDVILNKILTDELRGVRLDFIRFFVIIDSGQPQWVTGIELPIRLNVLDYVRKGNLHEVRRVAPRSLLGWPRYLIGQGEKVTSWHSWNVVGGCADFYTDFEQRRHLPPDEINALFSAVGYQRDVPVRRAS